MFYIKISPHILKVKHYVCIKYVGSSIVPKTSSSFSIRSSPPSIFNLEPAYLAKITQSFFLHHGPFGYRFSSEYASGPIARTQPTTVARRSRSKTRSGISIPPFVVEGGS